MREVSGPVIAIVLVLCAVFVPIAFLGGLSGELYRQFAVTISMAVIISGIVALTPHAEPVRAAPEARAPGARALLPGVQPLLRARHPPLRRRRRLHGAARRHRPGAVRRHGAAGRRPVAHHAGVAGARRGPGLVLLGRDPARRRVAGAHRQGGARGRPTSSSPTPPTRTSSPSPASTSSAAATATTRRRSSSPRSTGTSASSAVPAAGGRGLHEDGAHQGGTGAGLQPAADLRPRHRGRLRALPAEPRRGRREAPCARCRNSSRRALAQSKLLAGGVQTLWRATVPQLYVDVDRERAKALGVPVDELFNTLSATLGSYYVNDFNKYGRTWQVLMSAESGYRKRPDDIGRMWVRSGSGEMVPRVGAGHGEVLVGAGDARSLQQPARGEADRPGRAGRQLRPGDRRGGTHRARGAAAGLQLRLGRRLVPGEARVGHLGPGAGAGRADGVPDPVGAVREVVAAALGDARAAVRHVRRAGGGVAARHDQRRVLPDRPGHAARPGGEERDPDRPVRVA